MRQGQSAAQAEPTPEDRDGAARSVPLGIFDSKACEFSMPGKLEEWMKAQGDEGVQTELDAIFRLRKNAGKSREDALKAWQNRKPRRARKKAG